MTALVSTPSVFTTYPQKKQEACFSSFLARFKNIHTHTHTHTYLKNASTVSQVVSMAFSGMNARVLLQIFILAVELCERLAFYTFTGTQES